MTIEDFTTYTEVDPGGIRIEVTSSRVTWTILRRNVDGYVYKDYNASFFSGDFIFQQTFRVTGGNNGGAANLWTLANLVDDAFGIRTANGDAIYASIKRNDITDVPNLSLSELDGGTVYTSGTAFEISDDTDYYITIVRDESIGTYGTFTMFTYSDADRTTLVNTQAITLHTSKKDYRYIYACQSFNTGTNQSVSAYTENMTIVENWGGDFSIEAPSVTTQAVSAITATTATGNGNVTVLGNPSATQHGHVWATHTNPTTADNKTENGTAPTGAYTSSITGLTTNTLYYVKAYVTNSVGTFYGAVVSFTSSAAAPSVTTAVAEDVATTTALGIGGIVSSGGSAITQHGVVWDTSVNPDTSDSKTEEGANSLLGRFSSQITSLSANTLYHVRAYATNSTGTGYGADVTFTTLAIGVPIVSTQPTTDVLSTTATGNGNIANIGGASVTEHGHCWSTTPDPTTADSKTTNGTASAGAFISSITGLTAGTAYYVRAYATNSLGTAYGNNDLINLVTTEVPPGTAPGVTPGRLDVLDDHLVYISQTGKQRRLLGIEF